MPMLTKRTGRIVLITILVLAFAPLPAVAVQVENGAFNYVVDIPEGWEILDQSNAAMISFTDPDRVAVLQVFVFQGNRFVTAEELSNWLAERFQAETEEAPFRFNGMDSRFGNIAFSTGNFVTRGYGIYLNGQEFDYAALATVGEEFYDAYHDRLLSALDSFGLGTEERFLPGPVSQFYYAYPPPSPEETTVPLVGGAGDAAADGDAGAADGEITLRYDPAELEATQTLIEREARVLAGYTPGGNDRPGEEGSRGSGEPGNGASPGRGSGADGSPAQGAENESLRGRRDQGVPQWVAAWRRYFRMIYRDNYPRLEELAHTLDERFRAEGATYYDVPERILDWLQTFEYLRTGTLSDFMAPLVAINEQQGDCDSLAMIYAILLHHLDYEAIIMVSAEYSHAMVGVDMPGKGARFPYDGREWLVAELTVDVEIGMIDQTMSDIAGWIGVRVGEESLK